MPTPNLAKLAHKWAPRLGLSNWKIKLKWVSPREMNETDDLGEVSYNAMRRTAAVRVLKPDLAPDVDDYDPEFIMLHELLHLVFSPVIEAESATDRTKAIEHAIDDITQTILTADRG